jgi:hypothetical protein
MTDVNYESISKRLIQARDNVAARAAIEGVFDIIAYVAAALTILWLTAMIFWPPAWAKALILLILSAGLGLLTAFLVIKPVIKKKPLTEIAIGLEKRYGKLQSRLIAALQLYDKIKANRENYSIDLIEKTIDDAGQEIKDLDFSVIVEKNTKPLYRMALGLLLVILAGAISTQAFRDTFILYTRPFTNVAKPSRLILTVIPQSNQAIKNEDISLTIKVSGGKIKKPEFNYKFEDGGWVTAPEEEIVRDSANADSVFGYTFKKIKRGVEFYAQAKTTKSSIGKITVIDPPRLISAKASLNFPKYTALPQQELPENDCSVTAIRGTNVSLSAIVSKPAATAFMIFADSTRKPMQIDERKISGQFIVRENSSYHIEVTDSTGLKNPGPIEYSITPLDDYPPRVLLTFPAVDIDLDESMKIPLRAELYDDYGFSKLNLIYWVLSEGKESPKGPIILKDNFGQTTEGTIEYIWNVENLMLLPGDLVYYYLELFDNDNITGPKSGVSKTYTARLPSLDEIMADITGSQKDVFQEAEAAAAQQKELKKELENISREMMKTSEIDWQKKQEIQQAMARQKEIAEKIQDVAQKMQENINKLEKNQLATQEMLDKMQEIQQLMEKVATPEMKEAMRKLEEAMRNMDPEKLREAMKNFKLDIEKMNENLDRTLALLKKFELEQKLDAMAKMAEKLAEQQQEINDRIDKTQNQQDLQDLQKAQLNQKKGIENIQQLFQEAKQLNQDLKMLSQQDMQEAEQQLNSQQIPQQMDNLIQNMKNGNKSSCKQGGKKVKQELSDLADMLSNLLKKAQKQQQDMITRNLQKIIQDIMLLSQSQENLADSTGITLNTPMAQMEMASRQKDLENATKRVANRVSDMTKETLFIGMGIMDKLGQALQSMDSALVNFDRRAYARAPKSQLEAMTALNQAAMMLSKSMDQAKACPSGTGMQQYMQQLSELGQMQQNLNAQAQQMMPFAMGQAMSLMQQQQLERMAAQQEAIRQQLKELLEQSGSGTEGVLGRLDELGKEMQKVADELKRHNLDKSTIERQERILSRLLDAQKSVNRRDYTQKREARTAEDIIRRSPEYLNSQTGDEQLAEDIKKALEEKYPRRYEKLIKEYFRSLAEEKNADK